jgi:hypothetical protein
MMRYSGNRNSYGSRDEYHNILDELHEEQQQRQIRAPGITMDGHPAWKTDRERIIDLEADVTKLRDIVLALIDEMSRK